MKCESARVYLLYLFLHRKSSFYIIRFSEPKVIHKDTYLGNNKHTREGCSILLLLFVISQQELPNMSDSSTTWSFTYTKLRFFTRIRRFLQPKFSKKPHRQPSDQHNNIMAKAGKGKLQGAKEGVRKESDEDVSFLVLQKSVKRLHFGSSDEKKRAAEEIKKLAAEDSKNRKVMSELGVIPPLVAMIGSEVIEGRMVAIHALIELANGTYVNKALILEAGLLSKLPENIDVLEEPERNSYAKLLVSISSLANRQFPFTSSKILPFLVCILESDSSMETNELCLGALHNLSAMLENAGHLINNGMINTLLRLSSVKETSEKALSTLGNLVVTLMGKKALENDPTVPGILIEIMTWEEKPKCQELSVYVLMILAHQSSVQREKMAKAGIVPVILEVALLGSPLAQKRALKLLQWFKDERKTKIGPHSGPQTGRISMGLQANQGMADEGKRLMNQIVKQSLYKNMETISRRANGGGDHPSKVKALIMTSSSKSLPY